jgi:spore coat protein U-like protein
MRLNICLAALAATAAFASPAAAQVVTSTAQAEARGTILQPLSLSRVQDLDFGTNLVDPLGAAGSVTIDADNGNRSVCWRTSLKLASMAASVPSSPVPAGQ